MAPAIASISPSGIKSRRSDVAPTPVVASSTTDSQVESSLKKQLSLLVVIRCLRTALLAPPPIVVPFYRDSCQLSPSDILWLGSWYSALVAICEMPSGILSDVLGRKLTLQLAFVGMGTCWIVTYGSSQSSSSSMVVFLLGLAQLLRALGSSLYSGTDMAFLFELTKKLRQQRHPQNTPTNDAGGSDLALKLESRQVVLSTITEAVVAALGGIISRSYGDSTTIFMSAMPLLAGALICFGLDETTTGMDDTTKKEKKIPSQINGCDEKALSTNQPSNTNSATTPKKKIEIRRSTILKTLNQPSLQITFGVGVVLNCGTYVASTALNPLLWQQVGISNLAGGFLQATNSGMTALGAAIAPTVKRRCSRMSYKAIGSGDDGTQELMLLLLSISAVAYGLMTWNAFSTQTPSTPASLTTPILASSINTMSAIGASWLLSLVRGLAWPVLGSALNAAISDNSTRATVLSLFSGAIKIGMVFTGFALGSILRKSSSLGNACAICEFALIVTILCCFGGSRGSIYRRTSAVDDEANSIADDSGKKDQ